MSFVPKLCLDRLYFMYLINVAKLIRKVKIITNKINSWTKDFAKTLSYVTYNEKLIRLLHFQ